jgi:hypothetical protein
VHSTFAFKINLRRYIQAVAMRAVQLSRLRDAIDSFQARAYTLSVFSSM